MIWIKTIGCDIVTNEYFGNSKKYFLSDVVTFIISGTYGFASKRKTTNTTIFAAQKDTEKMRCLFSAVFYECGNKISFPNKMRDGGDGDSDEDYDDFQTR